MITIEKEPNKNIENVFNNQAYVFSGDAAKTAVKAEWAVSDGVNGIISGTITANVNTFYVNLKRAVKNLLNRDNFSDTIVPTPTSYLITDSSLSRVFDHEFKVIYNDGTSDTTTFAKRYVKGVSYLFDRPEVENTEFKVLSNVNYFNYYSGVPFDISVFSNAQRTVTITNERTSVSTDLVFNEGVNRLFFSNGQSNLGFESLVPLIESVVNVITFKDSLGNTLATIEVYKHTYCAAPYLKWFNKKGGWSYFRFEPIYQENTSSRLLNLINSDTENVEDTISTFQSLGKDSELSVNVITPSIPKGVAPNFLDVYLSPKVFYYAGIDNQAMTSSSFKEVIVSNNNVTTLNTKTVNDTYSLTFGIPKQYTQVNG